MHSYLVNKIMTKEAALTKVEQLKNAGKKTVFTNGCFDIIHPGHVDYLFHARDLGDFLVLGLNTDYSVKLLNKAPNRPINNENTRALVLAGLSCVDAIVFFNEQTPLELIQFLLPDVLVKGSDYTLENIIGYDVVIKNGGSVKTVPMIEGYSTTKMIERIVKST
jgi:D-glycero-beta-D-manno-heptose 1-phosphate adenylyltransferase